MMILSPLGIAFFFVFFLLGQYQCSVSNIPQFILIVSAGFVFLPIELIIFSFGFLIHVKIILWGESSVNH